jgi:hypothetical protein
MEINLGVISIKYLHNTHNLKLNFKKVGKVKVYQSRDLPTADTRFITEMCLDE